MLNYPPIGDSFGFSFTNAGERTLLVVLGGVLSVVVLLMIVTIQTDLSAPFAFLTMVAISLLTVHRLDWGLYTFVGMVLLFDNFYIPGFVPITYTAGYYWSLNAIFRGLGIGVLSPMELHLGLLMFAWVLAAVVRKGGVIGLSPGFSVGIFFVWFIASLARGALSGGDFQMGLWETRALLYLGVMMFLVPQIIKSENQVKILMWIFIIVISIKALQGVLRFASLGFNFGPYRTLTNHEDAVFLVVLFVLLIGSIYIEWNSLHRKVLLALLPLLLLGFYVANRRAGYVALAVSIAALGVLLSGTQRKRMLKYLAGFAFVFGIYLAAFWNSHGRAGVAAQVVRSTVFADNKDLASNYREYASGLARRQEDYNMAATIRQFPIMGLGFGKKFENAMQSWGLFALKGYTYHNQIFWLLGKTGAIGFFLFFLFLNSTVMHGSHVFAHLRNPCLRSVCAVCVIAIVSQVVVSYADMQLTYFRNMVCLGTLMGLIPAIKNMDSPESEKPAA
jgi:hypothetical protein